VTAEYVCHGASFGRCYARVEQVRPAISRESMVRKTAADLP
jgi:hypothetical protein